MFFATFSELLEFFPEIFREDLLTSIDINEIMIWMIIFWISMLLTTVIYYTIKKFNEDQAQDFSLFGVAISMMFIFVAMAKNDPIFSLWGMPDEFDWVGGMFIGFFGVWKWYARPVKERVGCNEKEIAMINTKLGHIEKDLDLIRGDLKFVKEDLRLIRDDSNSIKENLNIIKNKVV